MADVSEEVLIERVIAARAELDASTPAELLKVLEGEFAGLTLSQVKKASNKATKRTGVSAAPAKAEPAAEAKAAVAKPLSKRQEKEAKKAEALAAAELKNLEATMMEAHRKLRAAKTGNAAAQVTIQGTAETFIQQITQRAISGMLEDDDQPFLKERIEADVATLEWVKLAQSTGAVSTTEDVIALGVEVQLTRLKQVHEAKVLDVTAARLCYEVEAAKATTKPADATANLDARVKAAAAAAAQTGGGGLEEMD